MAATEKPKAATPPDVPAGPEVLGLGFAWAIVELAPDGILVCDDDGHILMANKHVETLFGYDRDTLVGATVECLLPTRLRNAHEAHRTGFVAAPALRPMGAGLALFGRHADGSEFPVEVSLSPTATDHGVATVVIVRDVTAQRAQEQVDRDGLALAQDERIAKELHELVIGHLFASGLSLASIVSRNELGDAITTQLHAVIDELDTAIRQIRTTVFANLGHEPGTAASVLPPRSR